MASKPKQRQHKTDEVLNQLSELLSASARHSDGAGAFSNLRALQEEKRRSATHDPLQSRDKRAAPESPTVAAARVALEEARARRLAAEANKARAEEALKNAKAAPEKRAKPTVKDPKPSASTSRPNTLQQRKPSKVSSLFHNLILGLNVQARTWEAPTNELLALNQARKALGNYKFGDEKRTRALTGLLDEVRARGGDDADAIKVLRDFIDRKIDEEEAEKRMKAIEDAKKSETKGISLAEQEEIARLEIKAQQLTLQKLQLERREQERQEVEEIERRIREKGLPVRLSRPAPDPYAAYYGQGHARHPEAFDDHGDFEMFNDSGSNAFGVGEDMFGVSNDMALKRAQTLDGRSRGLSEQRRHADEYDDLDDEEMLYDDRAMPANRVAGGAGAGAHPLMQRGAQPRYETLGNTGLPKFNNDAARNPKRAQSARPAVNFRIQPGDPRLDPRSAYYRADLARAFRDHQLRESHQMKLAQQAEAEKVHKLEMEKKALADERAQALIDAQVYQERKLKERARAEAAQRAHDEELIRKRHELQQVRSMEEVLAHEEELNYLENLIRRNPRAAIPGFDLRRFKDEPNLLPHVLQLVEENIRRPEAARHSARLLQESLARERADIDRRERLVAHEEELNRLQALLLQHPNATIKGLDISRLDSDPDLLQQALRQVEEYICRGENPLEIPLPRTSEILNEARVRHEPTEKERALVHQFLSASPALQVNHLRSFPDHRAQQRFLTAVIQEADAVRGQHLIDRFASYGFDLQIPPEAASRAPLAQSNAPDVPTIVVEQVLSPPPTQDTGPAFPFPSMSDNTVSDPSTSSWKGKGREVPDAQDDLQPTYTAFDSHGSNTPHLPSPPTTTPGRTSAAHPSGAAEAAANAAAAAADLLEKQQAEDDLAAQEAELERERQEIVEAEEALLQAEHEKALIEAQKRAEEEAQTLLRMQDDARAQAAAELEEAAQMQAQEMAEADAAAKDTWKLPTPPAEFIANSPAAIATLETEKEETPAKDPWASPAAETAGGEEDDIEKDPAWGEASAEINDAWGSSHSQKTASPALSKADSIKEVASAKPSPKPSSWGPSIRSANSPAKSSIVASPKVITSPLHTPVASSRAPSIPASKPASIRSPSVKAMSPLASVRNSPSPAMAAAIMPPAESVHSEKADSPAPTSAHARSKTVIPATSKASSPIKSVEPSPVVAKSPTPAPSPARTATPMAMLPMQTPKAATPKDPTPQTTPKMATPAATPKIVTPAAVADAWGSPAVKPASPARSVTPKATGDAWGAQSVRESSPAESPAPAAAHSWGSPVVSAVQAKSPSVASNKSQGPWGASRQSESAIPATISAAPPAAGAWGTPAVGSPLKLASPAKSNASKASVAQAAAMRNNVTSPAFGLAGAAKSNQLGNLTPEDNVEGPTTAIKGSDPVVVSMAEPVTPFGDDLVRPEGSGAGDYEAQPGDEDYEDYSDEGQVDANFDPADFPIFMAGEPLDPGMNVVMNPPPHVFQERYPKTTPEVTEDNILNHMATVAHGYGYHAIYQCGCQDLGDSILVQGYMVHLEPDRPPGPGAGGPFDIPDKNAGKATMVSDASTPGWS